MESADLLIVMGTPLTVHPFAGLMSSSTLNQAEILEKTSSHLQDAVVHTTPTKEQKVCSRETKVGGDSTSPAAADGKL